MVIQKFTSFSNTIETSSVEFSYTAAGSTAGAEKALDGISVHITRGEYVAVLGRNGSGKTTFARLFNGLILPTGGTVLVYGITTMNEERIRDIRRLVGMVFQDPDSQIIGTTVAEDVAFGPENLGVPPDEIRTRVRDALQAVALTHHADSAIHALSAEEKQRVSLAGILAMQPECIIFDEAASTLDPAGKEKIMALARRVNKEQQITVLLITHDMEEACRADRVIVLDAGRIVLDGTPHDVFSHCSTIREAGLELPQIAALFELLRRQGLDLPSGALNMEDALTALTHSLHCAKA